MNTWQIKALMEWYKMLQGSAEATERGAEFDPELGVWTDPRKTHQYPYDTVYDDYRLPRPDVLRVLRGDHSRFLSDKSVRELEAKVIDRYKGKSGEILWKEDSKHLTPSELRNALKFRYGHLIPEEADTGRPSTMELAQRARRETALAGREGAYSESPLETTGTLQSGLEALDIPSIPGKEIAVIPRAEKQARVYEYKNVPNIQVDPSGEARIVSDYYDSIVNYRKSKTGEVAKYMESFDPVEQARRLEGAEQATPARYLTPTPEQKFQTTDTQKRAAHLRKALADLKNRRRRHQGRTGLPFNPKIWDRNMLPTGGPIQRQLERRKF